MLVILLYKNGVTETKKKEFLLASFVVLTHIYKKNAYSGFPVSTKQIKY